jgi:hypothetical protein
MVAGMAGKTAYCPQCFKPSTVPGTPPLLRAETVTPALNRKSTADKVWSAVFFIGLLVYVTTSIASGVWWDSHMLSGIIIGFLFLIGLALYLIPTFIARARNHKNKTAITALNIVAGWTFAGWVVALVWSLTK